MDETDEIHGPDYMQYVRTMNQVLHRPVRPGTCHSCGVQGVLVYRIATRTWCEDCVRRHFQIKLEEE
jgi:hypothetical protein